MHMSPRYFAYFINYFAWDRALYRVLSFHLFQGFYLHILNSLLQYRMKMQKKW